MSDLMVGLNPQQREAVQTIQGPMLVLAGPGSGKTRVLTHRVAYMIREGAIDPYNILAVTFTNKAAREMAERLEKLVGGQREGVTVGTFHAICARLLRRYIHHLGYENSFVIYDSDDQRRLVKQAADELNLDDKKFKPAALQGTISRAKNELLDPKSFAARGTTYWDEVAARVYERYQEKLQASNATDFDDLLTLTVRLLREAPGVLDQLRNRWRYLHVDEFQDTNIVQYEIVKLLAETHRNIFVVGDIDQGIYSWRGADYRNILRFEKDFPELRQVVLEQNYRSTQTILDAATAVIERNSNRKAKRLWTDKGAGPKIVIFEAYNEQEEADFIVREVRRLASREGVRLSECAVMYRTNAMSRAIEEACVRSNLPYTLIGGTRFYERREIKDLMAYLRLIHNPYDLVALERIINVPARNIGAKSWQDLLGWAGQLSVPPYTALQLLRGTVEGGERGESSPFLPAVAPPFANRTRSALLEFLTLFDGLLTVRRELTLSNLLAEVIQRTGYETYITDGTPEGMERWENVRELLNVTSQYDFYPVESALPSFLEEAALVSDVDDLDRTQVRETITMMTLHTAKGLEYRVVFIPGMEENLFPHSRSQEDAEQMAEERRLAYVGITRAKERLYMLHTFRRTTYGQTNITEASRFLRDIPPLLVQREGKREARQSSFMGSTPSSSSGSARPSTTPKRAGNTSDAERRRRISEAPQRDPERAARREQTAQQRVGLLFKSGDKVSHSSFGEGIVVSSKANGNDEEVTVAFPGHPPKRLLQSFANLKKV